VPSSASRLTIAIPTFDRQEQLARVVIALLPQIAEPACLLIVDNCSGYDAQAVIEPLLNGAENVRFVRNVANVGMGANILRCFELAESEWIWILGDDDVPLPDAVVTITQEIERNADAAFINFASSHAQRLVDWKATSIDEFVEKQDFFGGILFISSSVYSVENFRQVIQYGYRAIYTLCPHYAMLLVLLERGSKACFNNRQIIGMSSVNEWQPLTYYLSVPILVEFCPGRLRRKLSEAIIPARWPIDMFMLLLRMRVSEEDEDQVMYLHKSITSRIGIRRHSIITQLQVSILGFLLKIPSFAVIVLRALFILTGRPKSFPSFFDFKARPIFDLMHRL
jgi:abequosyltransferase